MEAMQLRRDKGKYKRRRAEVKYQEIAGILLLLLWLGDFLGKNFPSKSYAPYVSAIFYGTLLLIVVFLLPAMHPMGKIRVKNHIIGLCVTGSFIYIAVNFSAGILMKNLAANSYDTSMGGILYNIITLMLPMATVILVQSYAVNTAYRKAAHPYFWLLVVSLYLAFFDYNFVKLSILRNWEDLFIVLVRDILPSAAQSFLLTAICLTGGSMPAILYRSIYRIFIFAFPYIPSLPWVATSVIGITYPVLFSMFLWEEYQICARLKPPAQKENIFQFGSSLAVLVIFSWFIVGVFPIYPSVILTGSMQPLIDPGDVILVRKFSEEKEIYRLQAGDIISFQANGVLVTHRIASVEEDEAGNLSFVTKGDNNESEDPWTLGPNDLKGLVAHVVPKIGKPIVFLYSNKELPEGVANNGKE